MLRQQDTGPAQLRTETTPGQGQGSDWLEKGAREMALQGMPRKLDTHGLAHMPRKQARWGLDQLLGAEKKDGFTHYCPEPKKYSEALSREATQSRQEVERWQVRTKEDSLAGGAAPVDESWGCSARAREEGAETRSWWGVPRSREPAKRQRVWNSRAVKRRKHGVGSSKEEMKMEGPPMREW